MKADALTQFPWPELVTVPLILFFTIFVAVIIWSSLKPAQRRFERMRMIPLEGDENE